MNTYHPLTAYTRASHTVAKTQQVVMLYDGAIRFLRQAKAAMETGDISERYTKLAKTGEIIAGLQSCLDFENGGQAAQVLYDFYAAAEMRVLTLHRTSNQNECEALIGDLKQMRDVWHHIDRGGDPAVAAISDEAAPMPATLTVSA